MTPPPPDPPPAGPRAAPPPGCPAHGLGPGGVQRLYGRAASAAPAALYERLRARHGAVAPVLLEGDVPGWLVLGYREVLEVTRDPHRFSRDGRNWTEWRRGRVLPDSPIAPVLLWGPDCTHVDGAAHQRLRGAVHESLQRFDRGALRRWTRTAAHGLIDRFAADGRADLLGQYARVAPTLTLTRLLGVPGPLGPGLAEASRQLLTGTERAVTSDRHIQQVLHRLVLSRHEAPGHDLASWLIAHPAALSDDEVKHHLRLVLVAANESTTNLVANVLRLVLVHPVFRGSLLDGRMTLSEAVEQVLWDEPPIAVCPGGFALRDTDLGGRRIRGGDVLLLGLAAANADPLVRPRAGTPMHGNRSHLAFTSGPHECPGQDIGRAIAETTIEVLLSRLPDLAPAVAAGELTWSSSTWSRRLDALPVVFTPRPAGERVGQATGAGRAGGPGGAGGTRPAAGPVPPGPPPGAPRPPGAPSPSSSPAPGAPPGA
ncbi:cytochrome P450 [Streptomyces marincola]|uniref:cytochrome P450 n=1 Tax=Streptomyces marincola TaxID=2878388 RepID=UPI001CF33850|nr:cytochrome P450 [Streptomyces marincola]UCM87499.1 cytochrome P450 [Streptomyces marincola]